MVPKPRAAAEPAADLEAAAEETVREIVTALHNAEKKPDIDAAVVVEVAAAAGVGQVADFESAMAACGVGRFNVALLLCCFPAFWSAVSVTSAVSYIFSSAQCDMRLSLLDMGTVNAITYAGMISSAMVWGYLSDTLGRRSIMVWGFLLSGLVELLAAVSQNFTMLLVTRYLAGFLFNGPFAVLLTYIAELHAAELRARVLLYSCLFYTLASSTLPLLAWAVLPQRWDFTLFGGTIAIRTWNVFLVAAGAAPLLSAAAASRLPESPKFLMSRGRNDEALQVFRLIYSVNSRLPPQSYPVTALQEERATEAGRGAAALRGGVRQLAPLFRASNLLWLLLMCAIHVGAMFGSNTLRLWFPQLAAMLEAAAPGSGLCASVEAAAATAAASAAASAYAAAPLDCVTLIPGAATYLQSVAVGAGSVLTYGVGGLLVNACGKRRVAGACALCCALLAGALPAAGGGATAAVVLVATFLSLTSLAGAALSSIMVDLFPTTLRAMAVATFLMAGRLGTIAGNVIFPALLRLGCLPPFATIGAVMAVCGLACFFVPDTTLKKLQ